MKKILLSCVLASSFAMSADLAKCSEAFIMQDKLEVLKEKEDKKVLKYYTVPQLKTHHRNRRKFLHGLVSLWETRAREECTGLVGEIYGTLYPKEK